MIKALVISLLTLSSLMVHAADTCVVSPLATLNGPFSKNEFSWGTDSAISRAFQDIGYTPGEYKKDLKPGERQTNLQLFCNYREECSAALSILENKNGQTVILASYATKAYSARTTIDAIREAARAATKRIPRCVSN